MLNYTRLGVALFMEGNMENIIVEYREKIVDMVHQIDNLDYLKFIYNMMVAFKKKWGI